MSRTDPLCPIAHAACPARQRRMVQFIGSLTLEPAGYHGRAHLQRRLYLVPSMYNISMVLFLLYRCTWYISSSPPPFVPPSLSNIFLFNLHQSLSRALFGYSLAVYPSPLLPQKLRLAAATFRQRNKEKKQQGSLCLWYGGYG